MGVSCAVLRSWDGTARSTKPLRLLMDDGDAAQCHPPNQQSGPPTLQRWQVQLPHGRSSRMAGRAARTHCILRLGKGPRRYSAPGSSRGAGDVQDAPSPLAPISHMPTSTGVEAMLRRIGSSPRPLAVWYLRLAWPRLPSRAHSDRHGAKANSCSFSTRGSGQGPPVAELFDDTRHPEQGFLGPSGRGECVWMVWHLAGRHGGTATAEARADERDRTKSLISLRRCSLVQVQTRQIAPARTRSFLAPTTLAFALAVR